MYLKNVNHQLYIVERSWRKDHDVLSCKRRNICYNN